MKPTHAMTHAVPTLSPTLETLGNSGLPTLVTLSQELITHTHGRTRTHARDMDIGRNGNQRVGGVGGVGADQPTDAPVIITLANVARPGDPPYACKLRKFLKTALRHYGLRCVDNRYAPPSPLPTPDPQRLTAGRAGKESL